METQNTKTRRRRLAPALTAVATAGVMAVGFTQLGGASALTPTNGGSCSNGTATTATVFGRAGVALGKPKPRTVTVTRTKTVTKWKTIHHCKTVTVTDYSTDTVTETETETETQTVTAVPVE